MLKTRYFINVLSSGFLAWMFWLSYRLWTQPPMGDSIEESIEMLKNLIFRISIENLIMGIGIILILTFMTGVIQKQIDYKISKKELFSIFILNLAIVSIGILIGVIDAYNILSSDIERNF